MPAPYTPSQLEELRPKVGDDICLLAEKVAAFDSAVQRNVAWFMNCDGSDLGDEFKYAVCTSGNTTTTTEGTTSTTSSTSTTSTTTAA